MNEIIVTVIGNVLVACITGYCLIQVTKLKQHINSRMDQLIALTDKAAFARGIKTETDNIAAINLAADKIVADKNIG